MEPVSKPGRRRAHGPAARLLVLGVSAALLGGAVAASAQTTSPGPTNPAPSPQSKPGATIVVNPTQDECNQGWHAGMKWTKEQFEEFCAKLKASK
jgi:hypothetical protein